VTDVSTLPIFTVRRYASVVYAIVVCLSVCPSQAGTVPKQIAQTTSYDSQETLILWCQNIGEIPTRHPLWPYGDAK